MAKRQNTLLRHGESPREEDGAIEFWRLKDDLRNKFEYSQDWSDHVWKSKMAGCGGTTKRFQYCIDPPGQEIPYLRALQGHSISKVVVMKSEEIIYQKVYVSFRPPPTNYYTDNWMCDLDSDVAGSSKDNQRIQPKPNYQVRRDPYVGKSPQRKSINVLCLITTLLVKKNIMMSQTQQVRGDLYVDQNPQSVAC